MELEIRIKKKMADFHHHSSQKPEGDPFPAAIAMATSNLVDPDPSNPGDPIHVPPPQITEPAPKHTLGARLTGVMELVNSG